MFFFVRYCRFDKMYHKVTLRFVINFLFLRARLTQIRARLTQRDLVHAYTGETGWRQMYFFARYRRLAKMYHKVTLCFVINFLILRARLTQIRARLTQRDLVHDHDYTGVFLR